jgi:hypothetical protein
MCLNAIAKSMKLIEVIGINLSATEKVTKLQATKEKNRLDFIKNRLICALYIIIKRIPRQPPGWNKTFANHVRDNN